MNYIEEAENVLMYYNDLYRSVKNMDREINKLIGRQAPGSLNAVQLDETGIRSSKVEDTYNLLFKLKTLAKNKERTELELKEIDRILEELSEDPGCEHYGQVLKEWYIHGTTKEKLADQIGYGRRNIYNIKDQAIKKFAIQYFGLEAMRAI